MIKILHTADWHIGKILHKQDLTEDIMLFFGWLEQLIKEANIDVLLVSGDIFDLANPSNKDLKLYYQLLYRLSTTRVTIIITGGNHDSVSLLNAPSDILTNMNIHVVGGVPDDFEEQIIPINDSKGVTKCIVLAVPFLRDRDLRMSISADEAVEKSQVIPMAIQKHYDALVTQAIEKYGNKIPIVAMGHLFMRGAITSDSEREIHVGNLMGLESMWLHPAINYMALGHIHKPQRIDKNDHIRYSGSPIYLDFSEVGNQKTVIKIEVNEKEMLVEPIQIPTFRNLMRFKGSLADTKILLNNYQHNSPLVTWVDIEIVEPTFDVAVTFAIEELINNPSEHYKIIKSRITTGLEHQNDSDTSIMQENIDEISPFKILDRRLEPEEMNDDEKEKVKIAYAEILQMLHE